MDENIVIPEQWYVRLKGGPRHTIPMIIAMALDRCVHGITVKKQTAIELANVLNNDAIFRGVSDRYEAEPVFGPDDGEAVSITVEGSSFKNIVLKDPAMRVPTGDDDWDDHLTIGIHLKSRKRDVIFGGNHARFTDISGKCRVVSIKRIQLSDYLCHVFYPNKQQLHADWICD